MNLVFMNSLEKKAGEDRVLVAQVMIQESQGTWHVLWNQAAENGKQVQERWFEGSSWDEMLSLFRYKLTEKMAEGYTPLLGNLLETGGDTGRAKLTEMMHFYCELNENEEIYQKLRKWRSEVSAKEGNRPYVVASNRVLRMISVFLPYTREELLKIPGLGEKKVELYNEKILQITKTVTRSTEFPLDWVPSQIDHQIFKQWVFKQKELKYKAELDKQEQRKKLLAGLHGGTSLDQLKSELSISRRELVLQVEQIDREGYNVDVFIENELKAVEANVQQLAWKAFEEMGDRYLKPVLQKVYSEEQMKDLNQDQAYEWLRLLRLRFRRFQEKQKSQAS